MYRLTSESKKFWMIAVLSFLGLIYIIYQAPLKGFKPVMGILLLMYYGVYFLLVDSRIKDFISDKLQNPLIVGLLSVCYLNIIYGAVFLNLSAFFILKSVIIFLIPALLLSIVKVEKNKFHPVDIGILLFVMVMIVLKIVDLPMMTSVSIMNFKPVYISFMIFLLLIYLGARKLDIGFNFQINRKMLVQTLIFTGILLIIEVSFGLISRIMSIKLNTDSRLVPLLVYTFFTAALTEEFFFRGLLFNYFREIFPRWHYAIPLTIVSLIFGLTHVAAGVSMIILACIAGVFYGLVYYRTGNIFCAFLIHAFTNIFWKLFIIIK